MKKTLAVVSIILMSVFASAEQWHISGPRALGMGGAFTAIADGPAAQQWNPAGLVKKENVNDAGFAVSAGASVAVSNDLVNTADRVNDIYRDIETLRAKIGTPSLLTVQDGAALAQSLEAINDLVRGRQSVLASAELHLGFKIKNFAVSVNNYASAGVMPLVDTHNIGFNVHLDLVGGPVTNTDPERLIANSLTPAMVAGLNNALGTAFTATQFANALVYQAESLLMSDADIQKYAQEFANGVGSAADLIASIPALPGDFNNNETAVLAEVGTFSEIALGYGWEALEGFNVGANIKMIRGQMARAGYYIFKDDNSVSDVISDARDNSEVSWKPGLDLGVQIDVNKLITAVSLPFSPRVGISARNINSPKFSRPADARFGNNPAYSMDGQYRAGIAVNPLNFWTVALDADIVKNHTIIDNYDSRMVALGTEVNVFNSRNFNLPLRAGLMKNTAEDSDYVFTAGFGLNLLHFHLDLAGAYSTGTVSAGDTTIPSQFGASLALSLLF